MMRNRIQFVAVAVLCLGIFAVPNVAHSADDWQAGFAKVVITPDEPIWMDGYGGRTKPAEGKLHDLWAKATVLRDPAGKTALFISTDLIGVPVKMAKHVSDAARKKHGLDRADIMINASHTHCGPALDHDLSHMLAMTDADWQQVRKYQQQLNEKLLRLIDQAMADLSPALLASGIGNCGFASNRRTPRGLGPFDHDVPVLRVTSADGQTLRGVIFGYACHNTVLGFYQWCGDYAGFAQIYLEERHPDAVALFFIGCGADQNPLPRRKVELAEKYGRMLGVSVDQVLAGEMTPVAGSLQTGFREIDLEFDSIPSTEELQADLNGNNPYQQRRAKLLLAQIESNGALSKSYPYPVQVWRLGDELTWTALGGEVVVDYALRLKKELQSPQVWVAGYSNDVMAYIPSERVLEEGGYEGESSMTVYQKPSKWKAGLESRIVQTVRTLAGLSPVDNREKPISLFDGKTLAGWKKTNFGGEGEVVVKDGNLILETGVALTGITWQNKDVLPLTNYEVTLEAMRVQGGDFFCGLTFPVKKDPCSLIVGGWGGGVCGLSSINGMDASENETTTYQTFESDRWYKIRLRVTDDRIQAWIDKKQIVDQDLTDRKVSIRVEVELSKPFGFSTWQTTAALRNIQIRKLAADELKKPAAKSQKESE